MSFRRALARAAAGALLTVATASHLPAQAITIDPAPGDRVPAGPFGTTLAIGQTFVSPTGPACAVTCYLQSFGFRVVNDPGFTTDGENLTFRAYLATWEGDRVGTVLFSSPTFTGFTGLSEPLLVSAPNIAIDAGTQYVAYLLGTAGGNATLAIEAAAGATDYYVPGGLVFTTGAVTGAWDYAGDIPELDARFSASFTPNVVPEPSVFLLMAAGLAGLVLVVRRRRA